MTKKFTDEFKNLYSLSKTLRFSLIPVLSEEDEEKIRGEKGYLSSDKIRRQDKTEYFLRKYKEEISEDKDRAEKYKRLKIFLTELHKIFIKEALQKAKEKDDINFSGLFDIYYQYETSGDDTERDGKIESINKSKKEIIDNFVSEKNGIFYKKTDLKKILSKDVLDVLKNKKEQIAQNYFEISDKKKDIKELEKEIEDLANEFNGWTTYFKNYNEIRVNLYKDEGRSEGNEENKKISKGNAGQLTTRILDENFEIFVKNKILIDQNKNALKGEDEKEIILREEWERIFKGNYYKNCLLQTDINEYNKIIGEINSWLNQEAQKKDKKIKFLNVLYKQLLLTDGLEKKPEFKEINSKEELEKKLFANGENFLEKSFQKVEGVKKLFDELNLEKENLLNNIIIDTNKLSFYSNQIFGDWNFIRNLYLENGLENELKGIEDKKEREKKEKEYKRKRGEEYNTGISLSIIKELLNNLLEKEFKNQLQKGNFQGKDSKGKTYQEGKSNFENFIWNLQNYFEGLIYGRKQPTKGEENQIGEIKKIIQELEEAKKRGERIDKFILEQDEESFRKEFEESLKEKKNKVLEYRDDKNKFKKYLNEYFDRLININKFISLFKSPEGVDNEFLTLVKEFQKDNDFIPVFNNVRNYITQKDFSENKIKLNFGVKTVLKGFSKQYKSFIFKKDNSYFLGILKKGKIDENVEVKNLSGFKYFPASQLKFQNIINKKFSSVYGYTYSQQKTLKDVDNDFKKIKSILDEYTKSENINFEDFFVGIQNEKKFEEGVSLMKDMQLPLEIFKLNNKDFEKKVKTILTNSYIKVEQKSIKDAKEFIEKQHLRKYPLLKDVVEKVYNTKQDFTDDINNKLVEIYKKNTWLDMDKSQIEEKVNKGELWLFQIYNKDFSPKKKEDSKENLHTLYFKELFSEENQKNPIFKLSGGGEMFLNPALEKDRWEIQDDIRTPEDKRKYKETVYKHRRKIQDGLHLHLSIVLNNINEGGSVNKKVHKLVLEDKEDGIKVLGIDRGEKELAYQCLLDGNGKIIGNIESLNETGKNIKEDGNLQKINYHTKLDIKEKERLLARKSWTKIEGIKDFKKGYLSSIVRDISDLSIQENALIVLEDLNYGFKKGRMKIEKSLYQQFENALLNKLSYYVPEKTQYGIRNALQLTPEIRAQKYWGNQMGVVFYIDAKFTSKTCPNCGFRKRGISDLRKAKDIADWIRKDKIALYYEKDNDRFRFEYDWEYKQKINNKEIEVKSKKLLGGKEIVYSDVERSYYNNETKRQQHVMPTKKIKMVLVGENPKNAWSNEVEDKFNILIENLSSNELLKQLSEDISLNNLLVQFKSILDIRYKLNKDNEKVDHIHCPKCHFHTASEKVQKIKDGDANGAYNIARKGLLVKKKIKKLEEKFNGKGIESKDLKIHLKDWDEFTYEQWDKKDWEESGNFRNL